jgi:predicted alpha/beta hydrolase
VRQLWDQKGSAKVEGMDPRALTAYAQICGTTLAHAHARSGDRIAIASYLGKSGTFDEAMSSFAESYADQNQRDYEALRAAAADGRIEVAEAI